MEEIELGTNTRSFSLFVLVDLLLLQAISNWVISINKLISRFWFSIESQPSYGNTNCLVQRKSCSDSSLTRQKDCSSEKKDDGVLSKGDVEILMENLGMSCSHEKGEEIEGPFGCNEIMRMFDEKEPSLEEVKEAFDLFDVNKDGFIDAKELQRILCLLGIPEGTELESCRKMIKNFDENQDDRIDFNEFVNLMETAF